MYVNVGVINAIPGSSTGIQIIRKKITKASHPGKREKSVVWRSLNPIRQRSLMDSLRVYSDCVY